MTASVLSNYQNGAGNVSGPQLNTFVQNAQSVTQLRSFVGTTPIVVYLEGYVTPADGGQGSFYWNATGTGPDDNGVTNIVPPAAGTGCWTRLGGVASTSGILAAGWNNFIISPIVPPSFSTSSFALSLPAGLAAFNGVQTTIPAVTSTLVANTIYDYQLNTNGTFTVTSQPVSNYTVLPRYANLLHVWRVQTSSTGIANIQLEANTYPTVQRPDDRALTIDSFAEDYYIYNSTTNWSATLTVTYGELLVVTSGAGTGNVYQVIVPGVTGSSAPTSTAPGSIVDGGVTLQYYTQQPYLGMFRYGASANGIEWYFTNIALRRVAHRTLLTGSTLGAPAGTTLESLVSNYILGTFLNVIGPRINTGTYKFGMKMVVAGFVWINTTYGSGGAGGTAAGSSPFTSGYSVGSTVVDGTITWKAIYAWYANQQWFWMDTDRTFLTYTAPDSHDSYASTFFSLLYRYIQLSGHFNWLGVANSPQPSGSGTYYTYQQVLTSIFTNNLANLVNLSPQFLTQVFQGNVNPADGSSYTAFFLEDNTESYSGFNDAAAIFGLLGDTTNQTNAIGYAADVNSGIFNLYDLNFNLFTYQYGIPVSSFYNSTTLQFYPWMQAQLFPELHNIPSISNDQRLAVRLWMSQRWESWWSDKGKDLLPDTEFGFLAAFMWQDSGKAYAFIENFDRYFTSGAVIHEVAYYLNIKETMIPDQRLLNMEPGVFTYEDMGQNIIKGYYSQKSKIENQTSDFSLALPAKSYIQNIYIHETAGNAITGGVDIGTTNGGTEIASAVAVGANGVVVIPNGTYPLGVTAFSTTLPQAIYFHAHTSWNSASVDAQLIFGSLLFGQTQL